MSADKLNPLNSFSSIAESVSTGLDELFTSDEERLRAQRLLQESLQKPHILQAMTNLEEAKNPNPFVSGWRPALGWLCVILLAYSWIGRDAIVIAFDLLPSNIIEYRESKKLNDSIQDAGEMSRKIESIVSANLPLTDEQEITLTNTQNAIDSVVKNYAVASNTQTKKALSDKLPQLDTGAIMSLVLALLGLGATRTFEKVNGVARTQWTEKPPKTDKNSSTEGSKKEKDRTDFTKRELDQAFHDFDDEFGEEG